MNIDISDLLKGKTVKLKDTDRLLKKVLDAKTPRSEKAEAEEAAQEEGQEVEE